MNLEKIGIKELNMESKKRILTGIRPTGALHLGHYVGALETWLEFQDSYESFFSNCRLSSSW